MDAYRALERRFARINAIEEATGILGWDSQTMMPQGAAPGRAEQLATLRVLAHELMTAPDMGDLLAKADGELSTDGWQRANLTEMRRRWIHATAVPADLVEASSRAISACDMVWRQARPAADFHMLLPSLTEVLTLQRRIGAAKAEALGRPVYDSLLDEYEPGGSAAAIDALFDDLASFLPDFLGRALEAQNRRPATLVPDGPFPVETQRRVGVEFMKAVGFDFERGRLDVSLHPFCGGATGDVRITTRYDEADFTSALMGVLHETGHAMYEQNRPADWVTQPVGSARGMSMHESQSLLVEMQACRSSAFVAFATPLMRQAFGRDGPAWQSANIARLYTRVRPGFIRVDADEVTYPLHIMLRYRLERAMLAGELALADLPGAWNEAMRELLGIVPPTDTLGCLQDIHWPDGAWGYFPTYTLGALAAAQLFAAARRAEPGLMEAIGRGDFAPLLAWLRANVHGKGSIATTDDILIDATGARLGTEAFKAHLESRYLSA